MNLPFFRNRETGMLCWAEPGEPRLCERGCELNERGICELGLQVPAKKNKE